MRVWCLKVRRTAPSLTLKSLTVLSSEPESACWLSGSATRAFTQKCAARRCSRGCRPRSHTRTVSSTEPLRKRWPSGIAATASTPLVCPSQVLTRLLLATLHTLTSVSPEPLMMCWPSGVTTNARAHLVCPLKVWTSVPSRWYSRTSPFRGRPRSACRRAAPRPRTVGPTRGRCARERRRASTASRSCRTRR